MEEVHRQLMAVINGSRVKRNLPPGAVDTHSSFIAQLLSDSILDSTDGESNEVTAAIPAFARAGDLSTGACISLTGTFATPDGVSSDDYNAALETCVLDAAIALLAIACDAPELRSALMAQSATHFGVGVSAHGAGRVRVVVASASRLAELVDASHALCEGPVLRAEVSSLAPLTQLAQHRGSFVAAAAAASDGGDRELLEGGLSDCGFSAHVAIRSPGWAIIGAELCEEPAGDASQPREEVFRVLCEPAVHEEGQALQTMTCILFRSVSDEASRLEPDAAASLAAAAPIQIFPWELGLRPDSESGDQELSQDTLSLQPHIAVLHVPVGRAVAAAAASAATSAAAAVGTTQTAADEADASAVDVPAHVPPTSATSAAAATALNLGLPKRFRLRVLLREVADPSAHPNWPSIPYDRVEPGYTLNGPSEGDVWEGEETTTTTTPLSSARQQQSASSKNRSRSTPSSSRSNDDDESGEHLGDAHTTPAAAAGSRGDTETGASSSSPHAQRGAGGGPRYRVGAEFLVELVDGAAAAALQDVDAAGAASSGMLDERGHHASIKGLAVLPVDSDIPGAIEQTMPIELMEVGTAILPIALGVVTSAHAAAPAASAAAAVTASGRVMISPRTTAAAAASGPIVHVLLITGNSREEALAQLPEGYTLASDTDLAALAHASVSATMESSGGGGDGSVLGMEGIPALSSGGGTGARDKSTLAPITACILLGVKREAARPNVEDTTEGGAGVADSALSWEPPVLDVAIIVATSLRGIIVDDDDRGGAAQPSHQGAPAGGSSSSSSSAPPSFPEFAIPDGYAAQVVDLLLPRAASISRRRGSAGGVGPGDTDAEGEREDDSALLPSVFVELPPVPTRFVLLHTTDADAASACRQTGMGVQIGGFDDGGGEADGVHADDESQGTGAGTGSGGYDDVGRDLRYDAALAEEAADARAALMERVMEVGDEAEMLARKNAKLQRQLSSYFAVRATSSDEQQAAASAVGAAAAASSSAKASAVTAATSGAAAAAAGGGSSGASGSSALEGTGAPSAAAVAAPASSYATVERERRYRSLITAITTERETQASAQGSFDSAAEELQRALDDKSGRMRAIVHAFNTFKREIGRNAKHTRTGQHIDDATLLRYFELEAEKDRELSRMLLKHIHITNQQSSQAGKGGKDKRIEGLAVIDFEQLKIENSTLNEQIESRVEEISRLKKKTSGAVQVLTHIREKLHFVGAEANRQRNELRRIEAEVTEQRRRLAFNKLERERLRALNDASKSTQSFAHDGALVADFLARSEAVRRHTVTVASLREQYAAASASEKRVTGLLATARAAAASTTTTSK